MSVLVSRVDFSLGLVEDADVVVVHVRCEPVVLVDVTVERVAVWERVDVSVAELVVCGVGLCDWSVEWRHDEEELVWHTALLALRQHQASWEAGVGLARVELVLLATVVGGHDLLVEIEECRAVLDEEREFVRVAADFIASALEFVCEHIQKDEVLAVVVDVVGVSVAVVFGAEVGADDSLDGLVGCDCELVVEWNGVQAGGAGLDDEVLALVVSDLSELLHLRL